VSDRCNRTKKIGVRRSPANAPRQVVLGGFFGHHPAVMTNSRPPVRLMDSGLPLLQNDQISTGLVQLQARVLAVRAMRFQIVRFCREHTAQAPDIDRLPFQLPLAHSTGPAVQEPSVRAPECDVGISTDLCARHALDRLAQPGDLRLALNPAGSTRSPRVVS